MQPYQQRVVSEKLNLDAKIVALEMFINSYKFKTLPDVERVLLSTQLATMVIYSELLDHRIARF